MAGWSAFRELRNNEALREALFGEMERDDSVVVFGEDVGAYGGLYRVTMGLQERFGKERVRDTPISELGMLGIAVGLAQVGMRPVVEIMYMDFMPLAMDPVVTHMGTIPFIWDQDLPMVLRVQGGSGGSSPHHAKTLEAWFCHVPDVVVIAPATPYDHKGLLAAAIRDPRPVIFCESRHIYGQKGPVPEGEVVEEIGKANVCRLGDDVTVVAWGRMLWRALEVAEALDGRRLGRGGRPAHARPARRRDARRVARSHGPVPDRARGLDAHGLRGRDRRADQRGGLRAPRRARREAGRRQPAAAVLAGLPRRRDPDRRRDRGARAGAPRGLMATPVKLPPIATDTTDGTLVRWLVRVGERVEEGQVVAEVDTAKVLFEVEAPASGVVIRLDAQEGEDVRVGETLGWVGEPGEVAPSVVDEAAARAPATTSASSRSDGDVRAAPVVRRMADRLGVDLASVAGSGPGGRIMKEDVERAAAVPGPAASAGASRLRSAVATAMTRSWREVPHFSCELEVDTSRREDEIAAHGLTAVLLACVARRLAADRVLNATYDEERGSIESDAVNLGVAVAVEGGLVVPVIRNADRLTVAELEETVTALGLKARAHRLSAGDIDGVTFTVSNAGMSGIDAIVPIVHRPAVAILGVGARAVRPAVVDGQVVPRPTVELVLSCDHRAVDGLEASRWLVALGQELGGGP